MDQATATALQAAIGRQGYLSTVFGDTIFVDGGLRRIGIRSKVLPATGARFFRVVSVHGETLTDHDGMAAAVADACEKSDARYAA